MGRELGRWPPGKLQGAARHWLSGASGGTEDLERSAADWGLELPPELLEPEHFEVWPDNWPALQLFIRCQTQWRIGVNGRAGLDYGAVIAIANLYQTPNLPRVMDDLQIIEAEILMQEAKR